MSPYIRRYAKYLNEKALAYRTVAFDFCKVKRGWGSSSFFLDCFAPYPMMQFGVEMRFCCVFISFSRFFFLVYFFAAMTNDILLLFWLVVIQERGRHAAYHAGRQTAQNNSSPSRTDWRPIGVWLFGQRSDQRCRQYGFFASLPWSDPPLCLLQWWHYQPPRSVCLFVFSFMIHFDNHIHWISLFI